MTGDRKNSGQRHTLGLLEDTLLDTNAEGLVEKGVEHGIGDGPEVVVGSDVLLQGLAAASIVSCGRLTQVANSFTQPSGMRGDSPSSRRGTE